MSRVVCCMICGVEQHPDVIEGCFANARKQGLEEFLVAPSRAGLPAGGDWAHVWVENGPVMAQVSYPVDIYGREVG